MREEAISRGYYELDDKYICERHVKDDSLRDLVRRGADETRCDCRDRAGDMPFAIPISDVVDAIATVIKAYWDGPGNLVPWDGSEGGWQWEVRDIRDVLNDEFSRCFDYDETLLEDLFRVLH